MQFSRRIVTYNLVQIEPFNDWSSIWNLNFRFPITQMRCKRLFRSRQSFVSQAAIRGCELKLVIRAYESSMWFKLVIQSCDSSLWFKLVIQSLWFKPVSHRQAIDDDSPEWSAEWSLIHRWYIGADCLLVAFKRLPISLQNLFYKRFVHRSAKAFAKGSCNRFQRASLFEPLSKSFSNRESLLKSLFKFYCSSSSIRVTIEVSIQVLLFQLLF